MLLSQRAVAGQGQSDQWHVIGKWGVISGRWTLVGLAAIGVAVGAGVLWLVLRLPRTNPDNQHLQTLYGVIGLLVGLILIVDIVFVCESIAHAIWPNFVDNGT